MLILALDTTSRPGSIALVRNGDVLREQTGDPARTHAQRLPRDAIEVCAGAGVEIGAVELFGVAAGPGSFTGLRIGIAAIQGLAFAYNRRVVAVSTLQAIAAAAPPGSSAVSAWMDAQRGEVFAQVFDRSGAADVPRPLTEAVSGAPADVLALHAGALEGATFHGDGSVRYREIIASVRGRDAVVAAAPVPLAGAIGRLASGLSDRAVLPHAIVPIYVRRPDAELARDRRAGQT